MRSLALEPLMSPGEATATFQGRKLEGAPYDHLLEGPDPVEALRPDGSMIARWLPDVLQRGTIEAAFKVLRRMTLVSKNRGQAAGPARHKHGNPVKVTGTGVRLTRVLEGGELSNTNEATEVPTGIVGYYPRTPRMPYCRQTAFTGREPGEWRKLLPLLQEVSGAFAAGDLHGHAAQREWCRNTDPAWIIPGTVFSTVTVNRNWQTAVHTDKGDLGHGVMTALCTRGVAGGVLVLPRYRLGLRMATGGVTLADVHELHGNTPLHLARRALRFSLVCYYRREIIQCLTPEEERARASERSKGDPLTPTLEPE